MTWYNVVLTVQGKATTAENTNGVENTNGAKNTNSAEKNNYAENTNCAENTNSNYAETTNSNYAGITNSNYAETQTIIMQKLQFAECTICRNNNYAEKHKKFYSNK